MSSSFAPRLKPKRKSSSSILPMTISRSFQLPNSSSTVKDYIPIIVLLVLLNFLITGKLIPKFVLSFLSFLGTPIIALFGNHGPPKSITHFIDSKYATTNQWYGLTSKKYIIPEKKKYIFPHIEDIPSLREIGYDKLFGTENGNEKSNKKMYTYTPDYFELIDNNKIDPDSGELTVGNLAGSVGQYNKEILNFKRNGHRVYRGNENPEIVLVTTLNYEKLNPALITKIVQNRIDYAHQNSYAVYSRFAQEFIPQFVRNRNDLDNWARLITLKEAMVAFPNAKWFWYIDEKTMIMRNDVNIDNFVLKHEALDPIILRGQSVIPNGDVKTYENIDVEKLSLLITQTESGLNCDSFFVKNDLYGRALLDLWLSPLMRSYPQFRREVAKSLAHILQWHPVLLEATGILPPRTIASIFQQNAVKSDTDEFTYQEGDLVISFPKCKEVGNCEQLMSLVENDDK